MFRIGWTPQSHVPPLDSSVSRKAFGGDTAFLGRTQRPIFSSLLEIRVLDVSEEEPVPRQQVCSALDGVMSIKLPHEPHGFLIRQERCPPFQAADAGQLRVIRHEIHLLIHPDVIIDIWLFVDASGRHGKQAKGNHHLLLDARFPGLPVGDAINKSFQRAF